MRPIQRLGLALCMAGVAASPLAAQGPGTGPPGHFIVGVGAGVTVPISNVKNVFNNGVAGEAFFIINLGILPQLRFDFSLSHFDLKTLENEALGSVTGSSQMFGGVVGTRIPIIPGGPVRPYILLGFGAFNVNNTFNPTNGQPSVNTSDWKFGLDAGAGIAIYFWRMEAFAEGRIQNVYQSGTGFINYHNIQAVPATVGLSIAVF